MVPLGPYFTLTLHNFDKSKFTPPLGPTALEKNSSDLGHHFLASGKVDTLFQHSHRPLTLAGALLVHFIGSGPP